MNNKGKLEAMESWEDKRWGGAGAMTAPRQHVECSTGTIVAYQTAASSCLIDVGDWGFSDAPRPGPPPVAPRCPYCDRRNPVDEYECAGCVTREAKHRYVGYLEDASFECLKLHCYARSKEEAQEKMKKKLIKQIEKDEAPFIVYLTPEVVDERDNN